MLLKTLHIIEPTLHDQTGHCFSLVSNIQGVSEFIDSTIVWMHKDASQLFQQESVIERPYFFRRTRKLQAFRLLHTLLNEGENIFIPTATATDLLLLDTVLRISRGDHQRMLAQIKVYVHWLYPSVKRMRRLRKIALRNEWLSIACPTVQVQSMLQDCGFKDVKLIPYPMTTAADLDEGSPVQFEKLLVAGAARMDKGFPLIVELIEYLNRMQSSIPIVVQCSPTHKGSHPENIQVLVERLQEIDYPHQRLIYETIEEAEYKALFAGAIVLQPYQASSFSDRVSGITLDALRTGNPVVTSSGTWIADVIRRFGAGVVLLESQQVSGWVSAIEGMIVDWSEYTHRASKAGKKLMQEHDSGNMVKWLCGQ